MCNICHQNSNITIKAKPVVIQFSLSITRAGKLVRKSDFIGQQEFDPDDYLNNLDKLTASCDYCGNVVDLSNLEIVKSCSLCSSTEIYECKYNQMFFCLSCARERLNYCRSCPMRSECILGGLNASSRS